jgi:hypothetical protein
MSELLVDPNGRNYSTSTGFPPFPQNGLKSTEACEENNARALDEIRTFAILP